MPPTVSGTESGALASPVRANVRRAGSAGSPSVAAASEAMAKTLTGSGSAEPSGTSTARHPRRHSHRLR
ncbi:MAG: hypothetical protein R3F11_19360 [Verrucomicrobiales bacterium]